MCIRDRYPFQNNIKYLPKEDMWKCLEGLINLYKNPINGKPKNFRAWIMATFGEGLAAVSYTHLRDHETSQDLVCRLLLQKKTKSPHTRIQSTTSQSL